jgi:hypothetical protein
VQAGFCGKRQTIRSDRQHKLYETGGGINPGGQWTVEVFYKYQATETLALSLDARLFTDPAFNPEDNLITFIDARLRVKL